MKAESWKAESWKAESWKAESWKGGKVFVSALLYAHIKKFTDALLNATLRETIRNTLYI